MWLPAHEDNLDALFQRFGERRSADLHHRFNGWYRAVVEETNDPLNIRRVRVRIPELHNVDTEIERLPWALPAPWHGGTNAGSFVSLARLDIVYVCFEKNHPYVPIYCAVPDSTRRRAYSLWSTYTKTPLAVTENGEPSEHPDDFIERFLPKDGRPMSVGLTDRYGHFLLLNAHGFFPDTHKAKPVPVGTDAVSKKQFEVATQEPKINDPDLKYLAMGTKYGHVAIFGDQGYQWDQEFIGDFETDQKFEVDRYKYLIKFFNEQQEKERDQRRIEFRTRAGHKLEMRDVGWDKSRAGEYGEPKTIGNSQGRDERWIKLRSKGGHLIQALDKGFDSENDNFYKVLNQTESGSVPDKEDELGDDSRMIRLISRHGNQLILDDRGSSPTSAEEESPHGNGALLRTRKGYQLQMVDKPELDHLLIASPKDQCFEINDRHQYIIISTTQANDLHTTVTSEEVRGQPPYILKTGLSNDPEANTCHLKLDKLNEYVRLRTPDGAGFEARGANSPCGQWTETSDSENRAIWMSVVDQWLLIRDKDGVKYLVLDDNDDAVLIRNEKDRIQIRANKNIEIKSDNGNICIEAPNGEIGFRTKKIAISTSGAEAVFDGQGIGSTRLIQGAQLDGLHVSGSIPAHIVGRGDGIPNPKGASPCKVDDKTIGRKKPNDFDKERGCDPAKAQKGAVPEAVTNGGSDGGPGGPGSGDGSGLQEPQAPLDRPDPSPFVPDQPASNSPITPEDDFVQINPNGGGVLWYGLSTKFQSEVEASGLLVKSFANYLNVPPNQTANKLELAIFLEDAIGRAQEAQERYGQLSLVLRIRNVPDVSLLENDGRVMVYPDDIPLDNNIEIFLIGDKELTAPPLFPDV